MSHADLIARLRHYANSGAAEFNKTCAEAADLIEENTKPREWRLTEEGVHNILAPYLALIRDTPALNSLLYDMDMLPVQTATRLGATRLARLCEAWKAGELDTLTSAKGDAP